MAGGIMAMQQGRNSRRGRPPHVSNGEAMQGIGWIALTLGTAAIVAGLGSRNRAPWRSRSPLSRV